MTAIADASRNRWISAAILGLALLMRCGVAVNRVDQLTVDRDAYLGIADNLKAGNGFCTPGSKSPTAYRPPLYPLLLAGGMTVLPTHFAVAAINILAGCLTVWLVGRIGARLGLGASRHLAEFLIAVDPLLLNATAQPMTEAVFTAITTAWLWTMIPLGDSPPEASRSRSLLSGVLFGLAALCRPTIWPLAGLLGLTWIISPATRRGMRGPFNPVPSPLEGEGGRRPDEGDDSVFDRPLTFSPEMRARRPLKQVLSRPLLIVVVVALVVSPWVVRNQLVFGRPILTTTHGGYTLLLANNDTYYHEVVTQPWGTVWSGDSLDRWQRNLLVQARTELGPNAGELAQDAWMSSTAKRYIREHPGRFLQAMLHRVRSLWSIVPHGEGRSLPTVIVAGVAVFYGLEFLTVVLGGWRILQRKQLSRWLPAFLLVLTIQGVHLVYWTDARMRTPLEPVLALLAASAVRVRGGE